MERDIKRRSEEKKKREWKKNSQWKWINEVTKHFVVIFNDIKFALVISPGLLPQQKVYSNEEKYAALAFGVDNHN